MSRIAAFGAELAQLHQSIATEKVIRADDAESTFDMVAGGINSVTGTPGLGAPFGRSETLRQVIHLLIGVIHLDFALEAAADDLFEGLFQLLFNDKYHLAEAGQNGIMYRIINNDLAVGAQRVDLLQTAVAAAHTGGQNQKSRLFHTCFLRFSGFEPIIPQKAPVGKTRKVLF